MRIGLFHGWELRGSGSNEYTRYLARALAVAGHDVHILCREPNPDILGDVASVYRWRADATCEALRTLTPLGEGGRLTIHQLPHSDVRPVFVTDKQRQGLVKTFVDMTPDELDNYLAISVRVTKAILESHPIDILHANHMIAQPTILKMATRENNIPYIIYPHGSSIEYTVRRSRRFRDMADDAIDAAAGLIIGSHEVRQRLLDLYPRHTAKLHERTDIIGVGVDTSMFRPVSRAKRSAAIDRLIRLAPGGGKPRHLCQQLERRIGLGELEAVNAYGEAYRRAAPDDDLSEQLMCIPWSSGRMLLFVGALTVGKGIQSLIAALPAVLEHDPNTHLVIVGSGRYREVLEALVYAIAQGNEDVLLRLAGRGNDLDDTHLTGPWADIEAFLDEPHQREHLLAAGPKFAQHVHFMGRLNHDLLQHLFPCADIAVFPSIIREAYPLVLMEALSNGVMPAASNFSGFAEGLDQLVPELGAPLVDMMRLPIEPAGRIKGIANNLTRLLRETECQDRSQQLRDIAVSRYDWHIRAREMLHAYQRFM